MGEFVERNGLLVDDELRAFIDDEVLPGSGLDTEAFWPGFAALVGEFAPRHRAVLAERDRFQQLIDAWHVEHREDRHDAVAYRAFLETIGYLVPDRSAVQDRHRRRRRARSPSRRAAARRAGHRTRATRSTPPTRGGARCTTRSTAPTPSAIAPPAGPYDPTRGARVIAWVRSFLDEVVPLADADGTQRSHADVTAYRDRRRCARGRASPTAAPAGSPTPSLLAGYTGTADEPSAILLEHHGLGIEIVIDRAHPIGADRSRRRRRRRARVGGDDDHRLRGLDRRGRQRRQGRSPIATGSV